MSPSPKEGEEVCELTSYDNVVVGATPGGENDSNNNVETALRKRLVGLAPNIAETPTREKRLEVLYDGYYYDVTEFIKRHPGGNIIELYTESGEDATIAIQQFHYRSFKTVLARMKGLKRRPATDEEIGLDPETKTRHDELTRDFMALTAEIEADGLMEPNPQRFFKRIFHSLIMFGCGLAMSYCLGQTSLIVRVISVLLMTLAGGQVLWLSHEFGHNSFTGNPRIDRIVQIFSYGFVFGLSASSWNSTHAEHHAMPQHETKDSDLKTMPLIAFNKKVVRNPKRASKFWLHYQHILFVLCDTLIVTLTWKFNHHLQFVIKNKCWLELFCMLMHYSIVPVIGVVDWMLITWLGSIYVLGNLILSHTHLPIVEHGKKLHWTEYALYHTTNIRSSWWVDWWTGHLNYQIEHHLFPTMPEYKGKLCRDQVKAFAKRHQLPYQLCSYWEAVKSAYFNLEHVANEIRHIIQPVFSVFFLACGCMMPLCFIYLIKLVGTIPFINLAFAFNDKTLAEIQDREYLVLAWMSMLCVYVLQLIMGIWLLAATRECYSEYTVGNCQVWYYIAMFTFVFYIGEMGYAISAILKTPRDQNAKKVIVTMLFHATKIIYRAVTLMTVNNFLYDICRPVYRYLSQGSYLYASYYNYRLGIPPPQRRRRLSSVTTQMIQYKQVRPPSSRQNSTRASAVVPSFAPVPPQLQQPPPASSSSINYPPPRVPPTPSATASAAAVAAANNCASSSALLPVYNSTKIPLQPIPNYNFYFTYPQPKPKQYRRGPHEVTVNNNYAYCSTTVNSLKQPP